MQSKHMLGARQGNRSAARRAVCRGQPSNVTSASPAKAFDCQAKIDFLREDLTHLFDERGIDASAYAPVVDFVDPITKYESLDGYLKNINFLKKAFDPKFYLHEIWASDDTAVSTRWTMVMELTALRGVPVVGQLIKPTIIFTGTSTYVFDPATDKIFRHIDTWDSISNQKYFSVEGFLDFLGQVFQPYATPSLETPEYEVLKRMKDYQVRRYKPFLVAESPMDVTATEGQVSPAGPGTKAFQALAGFIFGKNQKGEVMKMTTPVLSDTKGQMQFMIGPSAHKDLSTVPAPLTAAVSAKVVQPSVCAVRTFNGSATPELAQQQYEALKQSLLRDGLKPAGSDWSLARYNGPGTPNLVRRNEILVPLDEAAFFASWL